MMYMFGLSKINLWKRELEISLEELCNEVQLFPIQQYGCYIWSMVTCNRAFSE